MVAWRIVALFVVVSLSGCVVSDDDADQSPVTGGSPPSGSNAGSPTAHGTPKRTEGSVSVIRQGDQYVATKAITFTNDFGGAAGAVVEFTTKAGGIEVESGSGGGYRIVATLRSHAATAEAARAGLERLSVTHSDQLGSNLALTTTVHFPSNANGLSGGISGSFPTAPAYRLDLDASSGGIAVADLRGPLVDAHTSSGGIAIEGTFDVIKARASSGGIAIEARAGDVDAVTGSGGVAGSLEPLRTGTWHLEAGSGGVAVALERGNAAFDVDATATSGSVQVSLRDTEEVGSQSAKHVHVRTTNWSSASTRVTVTAETGSGGVAVSDA